jgi:hypothetical protein
MVEDVFGRSERMAQAPTVIKDRLKISRFKG